MKKSIIAAAVLCGAILTGADLYLVGDSTMCQYSKKNAPWAGWGQFVQTAPGKKGKVFNCAIGGRSSKSYRETGAWESKVMKKAKAGDIVVIQFGHNDANPNRPKIYTDPATTFKTNMENYVKEAKAKKLQVILATPTSPRRFNKRNQAYTYLDGYAKSIREVAEAQNVPVIDMTDFGVKLNQSAGTEGTKKIYMFLKPGDSPNYPKGREDGVHLQENGAKQYAEFFIKEVKARKLPGAELF